MAHYRLIDWLTQLYLVVVALLVALCGSGRVTLWALLLGAHGVGVLAVHVLILAHARRPKSRTLELLRHVYPLLLYAPLYCETGLLNRMIVASYQDRFFIELEQSLFRCQPSIALMDQFPHALVSELLYLSYFSFYPMVVAVGLALYLLRRERVFHYVSIVSFVFYICFLTFIFLPVAGPPVFWMEDPELPTARGLPELQFTFPAVVQRGPFFQLMKFIYRFEIHGGAFPSSHVAVAICTVYFSWLYFPRIRYFHLLAVILLCLSTVYCRYHYAVDVFAGALTAAILIPAGEWLYKRSH